MTTGVSEALEFMKEHADNRTMQPGPYGFQTTADQVEPALHLHGKNVIVTGGYNGIGYETARAFALKGAHVVIAGRDTLRGIKVADDLKSETGNPHIEFLELHLDSFASIREFANKFDSQNVPLHYLINNAGVMVCPYGKTKDGLETHMGVNHYGHFLLTNLLISRLIQGAPSRVINVSAAGHAVTGIHWDDINWEKTPYNEMQAYAQSKTANILFSVELTRRYKDQGVISNAVHPGVIHTELMRHLNPELISKVMQEPGLKLAMKFSGAPKTPQQGAATTVYAALSPEASDGGKFYEDCHEAVDPPALPHALDPEAAKRLWILSENVVGLKA